MPQTTPVHSRASKSTSGLVPTYGRMEMRSVYSASITGAANERADPARRASPRTTCHVPRGSWWSRGLEPRTARVSSCLRARMIPRHAQRAGASPCRHTPLPTRRRFAPPNGHLPPGGAPGARVPFAGGCRPGGNDPGERDCPRGQPRHERRHQSQHPEWDKHDDYLMVRLLEEHAYPDEATARTATPARNRRRACGAPGPTRRQPSHDPIPMSVAKSGAVSHSVSHSNPPGPLEGAVCAVKHGDKGEPAR